MSDTLKALNLKLSTELAYFSTAFCRDAVYNAKTFNGTLKHTFVLRRWCEHHATWHMLPARKRRPWRLVEDEEAQLLELLAEDESILHLDKALWDLKKKHHAYFEILEELEKNALNARREQKRQKTKEERSNRQPPRVAAEFIPRIYLMEFATCYRKTQYSTEKEAEEAIFVLHKNEITKMNAYRCQYCKHHHVGHKPRRKPSPSTQFKHAKKYWRDYPEEANRFAAERNLLLG